MRRNNKGFSLVELIVAFAIFAIVGIAICSFMAFSNNTFASSNKNIKLQYEQQVVVNRLRDVLLETSRGINWDPDTGTLTVLSDNIDEVTGKVNQNYPYKVARIQVTVDSETELSSLTITEGNIVKVETLAEVDAALGSADGKKTGVLCDTLGSSDDTIPAFDVDVSEIEKGKVTLTLTFKVGNKEVTVHPVVTLRNMISKVDSTTKLDDLYEGQVVEFYSKVASVVIVRDGVQFTSGRTDTIAMAGDTTVVDYDAIVTKKNNIKDEINHDVTWEIELSSIKDAYKYEDAEKTKPSDAYKEFISIDPSTGKLTVHTKEVQNGAGTRTVGPSDVMEKNYVIIKAISNEDPSKMARLRVKVTEGGVYPVKITTDESYKTTYELDKANEQATFKFTHSIEYTGKVKDLVTGNMVNPLTGDGVYSKIVYEVYEDSKLTTQATIPVGAGFSTDEVNGRFTITKSMQGETYYIVVKVQQKDKNGEVVQDVITFNVPKDIIGEKIEVTVPVANVPKTFERAAATAVSANWSEGVPTYMENGREKQYYYWYEWEITPSDKATAWGNNKLTSFYNNNYKNVFFEKAPSGEDQDQHQIMGDGTRVSMYQTNRIPLIYVKPYLDWDKTFMFDVSLRVKLSKDNNERNARYYMLPGKDSSDRDNILASNRSQAYVTTKTVTIEQVELLLSPAPEGTVFYNNDQVVQGKLNAIFNNEPYVGIGVKDYYYGWDGRYNGWHERANPADYYKIFVPTFKGVRVSMFNYGEVFHNSNKYSQASPVMTRIGGGSALIPYTLQKEITNQNTGFGSGFKVFQNQTYIYLKMTPSEWLNTDRAISGVKWICVVKDDDGNTVRAKFSQSDEADFINYKVYVAYEGEYTPN